MEESKSIVLALLEILTRESDESHILSRSQILELLSSRYQINIERRTLYSNINLLQNFGYDISDYKENGKGYYLIDRQFEKSEINLLCHSIHSSHIIPDKSSKDLINKLLSTQSRYTEYQFNNHVYAKNYTKNNNKEFFLNIEILIDAIQSNQNISFEYTKYDINKKRVLKRKERYYFSPYDIVYANERCYLIAFSDKYKKPVHFRIDKMKNIILEDTTFVRIPDFNSYEYIATKKYMYSGENQKILLRCDMDILDDVIDEFGTTTTIRKDDDKHFIAQITSSKDGAIYWAIQYLKYCKVLEPIEIKEEIKDILKKGCKVYN